MLLDIRLLSVVKYTLAVTVAIFMGFSEAVSAQEGVENTDTTTSSVGEGLLHNNIQPSLAINYIIATRGVYPTDDGHGSDDEPYLGEISIFAGNFAPGGWAFCDGRMMSISSNSALFSLLLTNYGGDGRTTFALPDFRGRAVMHEGAGAGLTNRQLGDKVGIERVTLAGSEMPSHRHELVSPYYTDNYGGGKSHGNIQPSAVVNYTIIGYGIYPSRSYSYIGFVRMFAGTFAPSGEYFTDGQIMNVSDNDALFSLIGTTYGGDGRYTFSLPDLRGRVPIGFGSGPGLQNVNWGQKSGLESVTLTGMQMAVHEHSWTCGDGTYDTGNGGGGASHTNMQPTLGMNYIMCLNGSFPSPSGGHTYGDFIGEVCLFAGNFAPRNWAYCQGQFLPINQYQALYSIIGTTYGGDGRTTFALPDLRGRIAVHPGYNGTGDINWRLGRKYGSNNHVLTVSELPSHAHMVNPDYKSDSDSDEICDWFDVMPGCNDRVNLFEDEVIDLHDFTAMAGAWLNTNLGTEDINKDGLVDLVDLEVLTNDWLCHSQANE